MKTVTRVLLFAILLQITTGANVPGLAQTRNAAPRAAATATQYKEELKQFDDFVARQMQFDKTPGLTIGFMKDDFVWVKGYWFSDLENKVPAKAESAYRLASVTKPMTAMAILQLVEKRSRSFAYRHRHSS